MEWLDRMNRAIDYIETNLTGEIELGEAARILFVTAIGHVGM